MTEHKWQVDIIEGSVFRNTDDGLEFMPPTEIESRLNAAEELNSKDAREAARLLSERINLNSARKQLAYAEARGDT